MKNSDPNWFSPANWLAALALSTLLLVAAPLSAVAQPVYTIGAEKQETPEASDANNSVSWRTVTFRPLFIYTYIYGDGIPSARGEQVSTTLHNFAGGLDLTVGTHWTLGYTGTRSHYSHVDFSDIFDHQFNLAGGTSYEEWNLRLSYRYETRSQPLVETGQQTIEEGHSTGANVTYSLGSTALLDFSFNPTTRFTEGFSMNREWPVVGWLHYKTSPWLIVSAGVRSGFVEVHPGNNMAFRRPQFRVQWRPADSLLVQLLGGQEIRTFYSRPKFRLRREVFSSSLEFRPTSTTTLVLSRRRDLEVSRFGSVFEQTGNFVQLRQKLQQHFELSAGILRGRIHYLDNQSASNANARIDWHRSSVVQFTTSIRKWMRLSASYKWSRNASNIDDYDLVGNQYELEIGFRY